MTYTIQMEMWVDMQEEVSQEELQTFIEERLESSSVSVADVKILETEC
jgi:cobalamin biosynthesis protein CbiG